MKAVLAAVLLALWLPAFGQSEEETAVRQTVEQLFSALLEARGEDAAELYSSAAMEQVEYTFQAIREGIRRADEAVLFRLQRAGYQAGTQEIRGWTTREYLAETLKLPMMYARYAPFQMEIVSVEVRGRRATVQIEFENQAGIILEQVAVVVREGNAWLVESFMGMTTFP